MFRKPTFSGAFTNFDSFTPISYKNGLVNTLIFRCFKICSSYGELHNKCNRYPNDFIDLCIKKFSNKLYIIKNNYQTFEKKQLLIILPVLGYLSFETRRRLNSCIRNQLSFCSLRNAFQLKALLSSLFKFKEIIPKYFCSHLIYKFSCSCCNATHYCETER